MMNSSKRGYGLRPNDRFGLPAPRDARFAGPGQRAVRRRTVFVDVPQKI
jgi:hypothetical protein